MFRIVTYVSSAPDTPPHQRAVAHAYDADGKLLPATQVGETAAECHAKLSAFLEQEVETQRMIIAAREASRLRMRAMNDARMGR